MTELFAEHKEELPDEWHETFDALTAQGNSPSGIKATIEYVTTPKTQKEVGREMDVSEVTIRNLQAAVIALGPVDNRQASDRGRGRMTQMDCCNYVADALGWEEGREYSTHRNMGGTPQPSVNSAGWKSLYNEFVEGGE